MIWTLQEVNNTQLKYTSMQEPKERNRQKISDTFKNVEANGCFLSEDDVTQYLQVNHGHISEGDIPSNLNIGDKVIFSMVLGSKMIQFK